MSTPGSMTTLRPIHPVDLAAERAEVGPELESAVLAVLRSGRYVLGPEVEAFERDFAALHGAAHGVAVGSGTDALVLALRALGIAPGDHVVTSPFSFFASAGTILWLGARPVLADVDEDTALLDPAAAAAAVDERTTAILPVHLYGQLCDLEAFRRLADARGLALVEDAAQAHGARRGSYSCGTLGDAAAFSFYPTKNLGAAGEGGMVLTSRADTAERLRRLRDHGSAEKYVHDEVGTNSRLQSIQAAVLNRKLPFLEGWNERRRVHAARYDAAFATSPAVRPLQVVPDSRHAYHQYTVRLENREARDAVQRGLAERAISAAVHYPTPVHLQPAASGLGYGPGDFPVAERLAAQVLCLPVHPFLTPEDVDRVAAAVLELAS